MGPQTIDRRGGTNHSSPPPESGDSVDRIDMARRNFENDPADVRAAELGDQSTVDVLGYVRAYEGHRWVLVQRLSGCLRSKSMR